MRGFSYLSRREDFVFDGYRDGWPARLIVSKGLGQLFQPDDAVPPGQNLIALVGVGGEDPRPGELSELRFCGRIGEERPSKEFAEERGDVAEDAELPKKGVEWDRVDGAHGERGDLV